MSLTWNWVCQYLSVMNILTVIWTAFPQIIASPSWPWRPLLPIFSTKYLGLRAFWKTKPFTAWLSAKGCELKSLCPNMNMQSYIHILATASLRQFSPISCWKTFTFWDIVEISSETHVRLLRSWLHTQNKCDNDLSF